MKRIFFTFLALSTVTFIGTRQANAQQVSNDSLVKVISLLEADHDNTKTNVDLIKRLTISGYIQAQWQLADTAGVNSAFSGGVFPKASDNRFMVRRGRVKVAYTNELSTFVLQVDATEKGVTLKDAYAAITDPWLQFFTLTAGVFNRPFGYEITYSSSVRESPERARIFQTLFPGERDLGAMLTLQPKKGTRYDFIKLDLGVITGNGINSGFDSHKDFISHLYMTKANAEQTFKYGLGVSFYDGGDFQGTKYVYNMGTVADGSNAFIVDSTSTNKNEFAKRQYLGFDAQASLQSVIGITTLRAEYLTGKQPGSGLTSVSPATSVALTTDTYNRQFQGGYVYLIQNIGHTKNQLVVKYDWYDPNTKVSGKQITAKNEAGAKTNLTAADIKFTTLGLGWNYRFNSQVKFSAFYEIVKNETTGISGANSTNNFTKDLTDNILTLRVQYKF